MRSCKAILTAAAAVLLTCGLFVSYLNAAVIAKDTKVPYRQKHVRAGNHFLESSRKLMQQSAQIRDRGNEPDLRRQIAVLYENARQAEGYGLPQTAADTYLRIGELHAVLSQSAGAAAAYVRSLGLSNSDQSLRCSALGHLTRLYATLGNKSKSTEYSEQSKSVCASLADQRVMAEILEARGESLYYSNEVDGPERALILLLQANSLFEEEKDFNGQGQALLAAAYASSQKGDTRQGVKYAEAALAKWFVTNNRHGLAQAHSALGWFSISMGDPEHALSEYERALPVMHAMGDREGEAVIASGQGYISLGIGDFDQAYVRYQRARVLFARAQDLIGEAGALNAVARSLWALRRYSEAANLYRAELSLAQRIPHFRLEVAAYLDLAAILERQQKYTDAKDLCSKALGLGAMHLGYGESESLRCLGRLYAREQRYDDALQSFSKALILKENSDEAPEEAAIHYELASVYFRQQRVDAARADIEKAIGIIEGERTRVPDFQDRASYFASVHDYYQLYITILMELHALHPEEGFAQMAFEASEKSKVRALLDMLSSSHPATECEQTAPSASQALFPGNQRCSSILTFPQIQSELADNDAVLLEYSLGAEKSYVWVMDSKQIVVHELLPATQIATAARRFGDALTAPQPRPGDNLGKFHERIRKAELEYPYLARQLARMLLEPIALGNAKRILIVPDGPLQYVPFAALPLANAHGSNLLLVNRYEIVMLPSVSALSTLRKQAANRFPPPSLAAIFADPVFELDDPRVGHQDGPGQTTSRQENLALRAALRDIKGSQYIPRLAGSGDEATKIKQSLVGEDLLVVDGFRATRDYILKAPLNRYHIIHFATHGIIDPVHPEMSGLVLSLLNRGGHRQNGYLHLGDIYHLKLSADLVVLSACESGLGKDLNSEGIIGLPRAFLYAGAKSVIASLWKVEDSAAAEFMKSFYSGIRAREGPSAALRNAQLHMLRTDWAKPFYWAAFVLQGDYRWSIEFRR